MERNKKEKKRKENSYKKKNLKNIILMI